MAKGLSTPKTPKKKDDRKRTWCAIVYPDSAPDNWRELLNEQHVSWACSPLHDKDVNPTGELKKPHWHIVISFDGPKSIDQIRDLLAPLKCPRPEAALDAGGAVRYFVHLDNPEKFQYPRSEIKGYGGFDVEKCFAPTSGKRYEMIKEMRSYCKDHCVIDFCDLLDIAAADHPDDWFPLLCDSCAYIMQLYLKSFRDKYFRSK